MVTIKNNKLLNRCNDSTKFWIFNIPQSQLKEVLSKNKLGAVKKKSVNINKININDIIFIASKFNNHYSIISLSMVDSLYEDYEKLFGYYESINKINLKSFKYFKNILIFNEIKDNLSLTTLSKKEIVEITKEDVEIILDSDYLINEKPLYLTDITMNYNFFLMNIIKTTYDTLNMDKRLKQMNITEFLKIVEKNLRNFDVKIPISDIKKYYSQNVWKLNYKHVPSRDSKKNIILYDAMGKSKNYGYIIFNYEEK